MKSETSGMKSNSSNNVMELSGEYEDFSPESKNSNEQDDCKEVECEVGIKPPPILIHCSAGVGRTGTFCCISNSIECYHANETIDIYQTVSKIRNQRAFSVQTMDQYQFCYRGILEYIIKDRHEKGLDTSELETLLYDFAHTNTSNL